MNPAGPGPVVLYDGVCGLCNRFVQFVLKHDRAGRFRFAALQSDLAAAVLRRHGLDPASLSTVIVVLGLDQPDERLLAKSRAALHVLGSLGGPWGALRLLNLVPTRLLDFGYDLVARNRYRVFGRSDSCMLPSAEQRSRFLDIATPAPHP